MKAGELHQEDCIVVDCSDRSDTSIRYLMIWPARENVAFDLFNYATVKYPSLRDNGNCPILARAHPRNLQWCSVEICEIQVAIVDLISAAQRVHAQNRTTCLRLFFCERISWHVREEKSCAITSLGMKDCPLPATRMTSVRGANTRSCRASVSEMEA